MKYFVYILFSESLDVYYKGFSTDVEKRLAHHLDSEHKFTSRIRDWKIVYQQEFPDKKSALIEERRLKKLNRKSIEKLIGENVALSSRCKIGAGSSPLVLGRDKNP